MQSGKAPSERNEMEQVIKLRKHSSLPTDNELKTKSVSDTRHRRESEYLEAKPISTYRARTVF